MRGYKAFNEDLTCRDMQYEIGKEYVFEGKPIPCKQGFHFSESIADCYKFYTTDDSTRICEVEATGEIVKGYFKYVTNKIKIIAEITNENIRKGNTGTNNSGYTNSGEYNSGRWNSGDNNSGNSNSGYKNSGNRNSGSYNSGDWNSGYRNSGVFNTEKEPTIKFFDKDSSWTYKDWVNSKARRIMEGCPFSLSNFIHTEIMTEKEKENHQEYKNIGGYIKTITSTTEEKQKWWDNLSKKDKNEIKALPNFDEKKFCECVGIEHI